MSLYEKEKYKMLVPVDVKILSVKRVIMEEVPQINIQKFNGDGEIIVRFNLVISPNTYHLKQVEQKFKEIRDKTAELLMVQDKAFGTKVAEMDFGYRRDDLESSSGVMSINFHCTSRRIFLRDEERILSLLNAMGESLQKELGEVDVLPKLTRR